MPSWMSKIQTQFGYLFMVTIWLIWSNTDLRVEAIRCFVCTSFNHSQPACDDPFTSIYSKDFDSNLTDPVRDEDCNVYRQNQYARYPGTACVKIKGTTWQGEQLVVRFCSRDKGSKDGELVRGAKENCGVFRFAHDPNDLTKLISYRGCLTYCNDDGCNGAASLVSSLLVLAAMVVIFITCEHSVTNEFWPIAASICYLLLDAAWHGHARPSKLLLSADPGAVANIPLQLPHGC